jgi:hypothetical protein
MAQVQKAPPPVVPLGDILDQTLVSTLAAELQAETLSQFAVSVAYFKERLNSDAARNTGGTAVERIQQEFLNEAASYGISQKTAEEIFDFLWK